jgi:hypothetical protein
MGRFSTKKIIVIVDTHLNKVKLSLLLIWIYVQYYIYHQQHHNVCNPKAHISNLHIHEATIIFIIHWS